MNTFQNHSFNGKSGTYSIKEDIHNTPIEYKKGQSMFARAVPYPSFITLASPLDITTEDVTMTNIPLKITAHTIFGTGMPPYGSPHIKIIDAITATAVNVFENFEYFFTDVSNSTLDFPVLSINSSISKPLRLTSRLSIFR